MIPIVLEEQRNINLINSILQLTYPLIRANVGQHSQPGQTPLGDQQRDRCRGGGAGQDHYQQVDISS